MITLVRWLLLLLFAFTSAFVAYALISVGVDDAASVIVGIVVGLIGWRLTLRLIR